MKLCILRNNFNIDEKSCHVFISILFLQPCLAWGAKIDEVRAMRDNQVWREIMLSAFCTKLICSLKTKLR